MTGVLVASPGGRTAWTFSVIFKIVGAAAIAPTVAAPTAVFCRKPRLDIFDFFSSAIRFPSVLIRERNSRTFPWRPDRVQGYFDVCNIVCYKEKGHNDRPAHRTQRPRMSGRGFEPRTFGCLRSAAVRLRKNPMSPTLHQAEPPRRGGP